MYKFSFLLLFSVLPQQLVAIPASIACIVRTFEGQNKQKGTKAKTIGAVEPLPLSNVQQARLAIDEAIKDSKLVNHPATWYYRGVIYDRLLRDHIAEAPTFLHEALAAYAQAKKLSVRKSKQFHSFAVANLSTLWHYFLNRGLAYYRQEAVDQAIEQFTICRRILPEASTPLLYMAIVYHSVDQLEEALRYYQEYVALQGPQFAIARAMAAIHYHKLKNFDKAIAILNEALIQFPFNNELLEEKCLIYEAAGCMDAYIASLAVEGQKIDAWYAYAYFLEHQERIQEAIACYQEVLKIDPHQYATLRQMGFLFYNQAIKLYADTVKLVGQKSGLADSVLADCSGLMQVTVSCLPPYAMSGSGCALPIWGARLPGAGPFVPRVRWVVYDHPLVKHSRVSSFEHLVQAGSLSYTSLGYMYTKSVMALAANKWVQTIAELEKYLKRSLNYLKLAHAGNKKDKAVAQALYYSYYHLKKYGSAYRLLQGMQKQYLDDDPFMEHKAKA